jgi:hypothetical protein
VKNHPLPESEWKRIAVELSEKYAGSADQILVEFFDDASILDGWDGTGLLADTDWPHWLCRVATDKVAGRFQASTFKIAPSTVPSTEWTPAKEKLAREMYNASKAEYEENIARIRRGAVMEHDFPPFSTFEEWKKSNRRSVEAEFARRPVRSPPKAEPPEYRIWTSADGKFKVEATFVKFIAGTVHLKRKDNGQEIAVPSGKLSDEDQQYIKRRR